jgi:hypothetical protein
MAETKCKEKKVERAAYSLEEFSQMLGHNRAWGYRMAKDDRIRVIRGYGKALVPASELERILNGEGQA